MTLEIASSRLRLIALDAELARLQLDDRLAFFKALGVEIEPSWPPELMDKNALHWAADRLSDEPGQQGWHAWVYISPVLNRLVGCAGYKGPPDANGSVEIGYSMLQSYREQGLATEGVMTLLEWAYRHETVKSITAVTRADRDASHRVLEKAGFQLVGTRFDEAEDCDVVEWEHHPAREVAA
ncbi:GNAT family N-acetyltransferase [Maricaulis sp.]|uniref:GNAT family N-acetyltransferase n=1 Tax=Maricaulis sp. TaxID=1486257 RepID=UPI001B12784F|nr:GNAT family N-acetyltransferase [Maricaulis sp.]MBO6795628.1 GNAT family N-acetyltransferase [Maricaulis sp.]